MEYSLLTGETMPAPPSPLEALFYGLINTRPERVGEAIAVFNQGPVAQQVFTGRLDGITRTWSAAEAYTWGWCRRHMENRPQPDLPHLFCVDPTSPLAYLHSMLGQVPHPPLPSARLCATQQAAFSVLRKYLCSKSGRRISKNFSVYGNLDALHTTLAQAIFGPVAADEGVLQECLRLAFRRRRFAKALHASWDGADHDRLVAQSAFFTPAQGRAWLLFALTSIKQANYDNLPSRGAGISALLDCMVHDGSMQVSQDPQSTPYFPEEQFPVAWVASLQCRDIDASTVQSVERAVPARL